MKKLMLLAALLAMLMIAAVPAIAQVIEQAPEQEADSGDVDQSFEVSGSGSNGNQCAGINGTANTGNSQNLFGFVQYASTIDDFELEDSGSDLDVSGTATTSCDQQVNQAASAG